MDAAEILIFNLSLIRSNGPVFFLSAGNLSITNLVISKQICLNTICICNAILSSFLQVVNFSISETFSDNNELFNIESSEINFENGSVEKFSSSNENNIIMKVLNSIIYLVSISSTNLDYSFLYSTKSNLSCIQMIMIGTYTSNLSSFIIVEYNQMVEVKNSSIIGFNNIFGGAIDNLNSFLFLSFNLFLLNFGTYGGAIYTSDSNTTFINNTFDDNEATYGGGIYFYSGQISLNNELINNNFTNCNAKIGGGAYYTVYSVPIVISNFFFNNSAEYGSNYASPPRTLTINSSFLDIFKEYLPSSSIPEIVFSLKDTFNNTIRTSFSINIMGQAMMSLANYQIYQDFSIINQGNGREQIYGQAITDYDGQLFNFSNINVNMMPNSIVILTVYSDMISNFFEDNTFNYTFSDYFDSNGNYYYLIFLNSTECPLGFS